MLGRDMEGWLKVEDWGIGGYKDADTEFTYIPWPRDTDVLCYAQD